MLFKMLYYVFPYLYLSLMSSDEAHIFLLSS